MEHLDKTTLDGLGEERRGGKGGHYPVWPLSDEGPSKFLRHLVRWDRQEAYQLLCNSLNRRISRHAIMQRISNAATMELFFSTTPMTSAGARLTLGRIVACTKTESVPVAPQKQAIGAIKTMPRLKLKRAAIPSWHEEGCRHWKPGNRPPLVAGNEWTIGWESESMRKEPQGE